MRRLLIATAAVAGFVLPTTALASTETAVAGAATAKLQYTGRFPTQRDLQLSITDQGRTVYRRPISSRYCGRDCQVATVPGSRPVRFVRLARGGTPDVLVSLNSAGAHCCSIAQVFAPRRDGAGYTKVEHDFGDPGYRLAKLSGDGPRQFISADDTFAYRFTDFAASGLPIQVLVLRNGAFVDVTGDHPSLVRRDAAKWLHAYHAQARTGYRDSVGVIAAWAADEYTLGRGATARAYLFAQARADHLHSALEPGESGPAFVTRLSRFLNQRGYA